MSLSKKNLDKLNKYKENNKNLKNYIKDTKIENYDNQSNNQIKSEDPNEIFYSLIDNSESLDETSAVNHSLIKSELNQINMNTSKTNHPIKLTTEEELYDEFNYLLDE